MKIVLANGCFDILHIGHIEHLQEAAEMGDKLIVALTEDAYVNKGPSRPIYGWNDRAMVLKALRCVDWVIPTTSAMQAIYMIRPHVFVKGIDYKDGDRWTEDVEAACKDVGTQIRFTKSAKKSVTEIIRRTLDAEPELDIPLKT